MASDSMRARPMIMAVWIRAAAPGWRAIPSSAAAMARPWPRPQRPAASAMPMPAATTVKGPSHDPVAAASPAACADATFPPSARTNVRMPRTIRTLPPPLVMGGRLGAVLGFERARDVNHREHDEDEGLEERHQDLQGEQEPDREEDRRDRAERRDEDAEESRRAGEAPRRKPHGHEEEAGQQDVPAQHVAEKAHRERERAGEVADQLNRDHEGREPRHGPGEVLQVGGEPMLPDPDPVVGAEDHEGAGQGGVEVVRRGGEAGDEPEEVRGEDEEPEGRDEGQEAAAFGADDVIDQGQDELEDGLHHVLDAPGDEGGPAGHDGGEPDQGQHHEPRKRDMMRHAPVLEEPPE